MKHLNLYILFLSFAFLFHAETVSVYSVEIPSKYEASEKDWDSFSINALLSDGMVWELQDQFSDDFNYGTKEHQQFTSRWTDAYKSAWDGPGLTQWQKQNSKVKDGKLEISANRSTLTMPYSVNGEKAIYPKVDCGIITSKETIKFPAYFEIRMKVMNQTLSSNFWFLSENSRQELDVIECYGSERDDHQIRATQMGTNWHIFERSAERGIYGNHHWGRPASLPSDQALREDFHTYGAHWIDAWHIDWYLDGVLVRQTSPNSDVTGDPRGKTPVDDIEDPADNNGMFEPMFMIIDVEDHDWRSNRGIISTDEELADQNKNKMFVDWVRVYKPTPKK